jgi:flagellar motor protein MotB
VLKAQPKRRLAIYGHTETPSGADYPEGRARNRRVELRPLG